MKLTKVEETIMEKSRLLSEGGLDLFWMYWSAPEGATNEQARLDLVGKAPDLFDPPLRPGEFVPIKPVDWVKRIVHGDENDWCIVGGVGSGKTIAAVQVGCYYCCMIPNFRYLGTAPLAWQSDMSFKDLTEFLLDWNNEGAVPRRIRRWIKNVKQRPYPTVEFVNGSTMEFHSLDKDAKNVLTWTGDMAVVDQAEDPEIDLETIMGNLGSRLRGQINGRARLGKFIIMANSNYNEVLWETYDRYESTDGMAALLLTSYDNPYLTQRQLSDIARRYRSKDEERRMMYSERPLPKGKEFTEKRIANSMDEGLDKLMDDALRSGMKGYVIEQGDKAGIVRWELPCREGHTYITAGDPGQGNPPYRNSGVVITLDVTDFPQQPATLACFTWVYGYGSYHPFITELERQHTLYTPYMAAFDSTGTQKAFDDLAVLDQSKMWMPLNMAGQKMHFVLCLKVLMDRSMLKLPKQLKSIWNQLLAWCMPDKDLNQDIAATLFMLGYILNQLLPKPVVSETTDDQLPDEQRGRVRNSSLRSGQRSAMRNTQ